MARHVMKLQQLIGAQREGSVCPALVIAEFDFENTGSEPFDDRADLAAQKVMASDVFEQRNHR
jgi:hypothetical protein